MAKSDAPIIVIKRVKKGGHGHHGGAWKIAYADFVTAMMAFFLLMWVLGSTTAGDLAGISAYFQNPLRVSLSGGQGSGDATRIIKGGGDNITKTVGEESRADADTEQRRISDSSVTDVENARKDKTKNELVKEDIQKKIEADAELKNAKGQVFMDITSEGLRIQVVDEKGKPLFSSGGTVPSVSARRLLRIIGKSIQMAPGPIRIEGHSDGAKFGNGETGYTNWELSTDRANVARRELIAGGLDPALVVQVIGFANTVPLNPEDLNDPLNRRISITLLNKKPKQEEKKTIVRPVEKLPETIEKGAQDIPANLRAPAQFLSKDNAPKAPVMEIPPKQSSPANKPAR
ncbi:flagellar motor protein MotB [Polynucleobacter sp. UB-Piko-W3]|jgi:chemotaxis protein MotB|uniref:flagellar motor protein MotB n=1 Tax=Polynucleobacter sp. UB-Piko-W3 TaxID=1819735 RepID=UPI001C0ABA77|nr:flagellar motor protein MotB [Polynucleobacter sp. UB-Piko-W3]MBU3554952.1 flagellar motor protein MotB [Polynucleobacter sp. UB-Piko-W3]